VSRVSGLYRALSHLMSRGSVADSSTCAWIQEVYGIDNATLWSNNPQIDDECSNIYIGEVLCVDTNTFSYPAFNQTRYDVSGRGASFQGRELTPDRRVHVPPVLRRVKTSTPTITPASTTSPSHRRLISIRLFNVFVRCALPSHTHTHTVYPRTTYENP